MPGATYRMHTRTARSALRELIGRSHYVPLRTGRRAGTGASKDPWLEQPPTWKGTLPEWAIQWAHLRMGFKDGQDFAYQYPVLGNPVDFFEFDLQIAIQVQGLYWHYGFGAAKQQLDFEQKIRIEATGITVIAIDEDDALDNPIFYLAEARQGKDHSLRMSGAV